MNGNTESGTNNWISSTNARRNAPMNTPTRIRARPLVPLRASLARPKVRAIAPKWKAKARPIILAGLKLNIMASTPSRLG